MPGSRDPFRETREAVCMAIHSGAVACPFKEAPFVLTAAGLSSCKSGSTARAHRTACETTCARHSLKFQWPDSTPELAVYTPHIGGRDKFLQELLVSDKLPLSNATDHP